jgi:hypothetical protein
MSSSLRSLASRKFIRPRWFLQRWKVASLIPRSLATSGTVEPEASLLSACRSFRMICSEESFLPIVSPPCCAHSGLLDSHRNWIRFWGSGRVLRTNLRHADVKASVR